MSFWFIDAFFVTLSFLDGFVWTKFFFLGLFLHGLFSFSFLSKPRYFPHFRFLSRCHTHTVGEGPGICCTRA